jgi:hypothetical protein
MILRQLDSAVTIAAKAGSIMSVEDLVAFGRLMCSGGRKERRE